MARKLSCLLGVLVLMVLAGGMAKADVVKIGDFTTNVLPSPSAEKAYLELLYPGISLTYLNNIVSSSFSVAIVGNSAEITWDLTGTGFELAYILLKDGVTSPGNHLYSLYSVTPDQVLTSNGIQTVSFDVNKNISHISFFGTGTAVPEPGTLTLLGLGLLAGGLAWRRRK